MILWRTRHIFPFSNHFYQENKLLTQAFIFCYSRKRPSGRRLIGRHFSWTGHLHFCPRTSLELLLAIKEMCTSNCLELSWPFCCPNFFRVGPPQIMWFNFGLFNPFSSTPADETYLPREKTNHASSEQKFLQSKPIVTNDFDKRGIYLGWGERNPTDHLEPRVSSQVTISLFVDSHWGQL